MKLIVDIKIANDIIQKNLKKGYKNFNINFLSDKYAVLIFN